MLVDGSESKLKVCVLTSVHKPFDQRIFHKECRSLAQCGYDVTLIAPAAFQEEVRHGVRIVGTPRSSSRWGRPLIWFDLVRKAVRLAPDVVHVHDPELLLIAPLIKLALRHRARIVYDVHEYFVDSIAHKVWIPSWLRPAVSWLSERAERLLGRAVDGIVFVIEDQVPLYNTWRSDRVVVHNYPNPEAFADARPLPDFPPHRFRMIYIGSLYERRGIATLLSALPLIVDQVPEALLLLGGSFESDAFRQWAETYIARHELQSHVAFLGWVDRSALPHYLASADVAWLPGLPVKQYRHRAISVKQLECMLMGLPVVSSDLPHRRAFIEAADCGLLVTPDDPIAHAEAILWLQQHPQERQEMGSRGRRLVLDRYTWQSEASRLVAFYDRLLTNRSRNEPI